MKISQEGASQASDTSDHADQSEQWTRGDSAAPDDPDADSCDLVVLNGDGDFWE